MNRFGIPQERIAKRLGVDQKTIHNHLGKKPGLAILLNADWRDFQNRPADSERREKSIFIDEYLKILNKAGWLHSHIIQAPMSSERFNAVVVSAMQKKRILGVTSRYVIVLK